MNTDGPIIKIEKGVFMARGQRVVAVPDAAAFYEVTPHALLCAVARNPRKFTRQFMFRLTPREVGRTLHSLGLSGWDLVQ